MKRKHVKPTAAFTLPVEFLRERRQDALALARIGAGINSLDSALRLMLMTGEADTPSVMLARVHSLVAAIAYLREIGRTVERARYWDRLWELVEIGTRHGFSIGMPIEEVKALLSANNPDLEGTTLGRVRNKIGFHWDEQPFATFLDDEDVKEHVVLQFGGPKKYDRIFRSSADAVSNWLSLLATGGKPVSLTELSDPLLQAWDTFGDVLEAAYAGLLVEAAKDPADYFQDFVAPEDSIEG